MAPKLIRAESTGKGPRRGEYRKAPIDRRTIEEAYRKAQEQNEKKLTGAE